MNDTSLVYLVCMDHGHEHDEGFFPNMFTPACVGRPALNCLPEQWNDFIWISSGAWT